MPTYEEELRQIAEEEGVGWDAARRVIMSEGGLNDPYRRSEAPGEYSLGPLQLNMRKGVGAEALKAGIDASKDWKAAYRYGLQWAKKNGWLGDWMGARKIGIANRAGLGGGDAKALGGDQYSLKKRHVGGAGSSPGYFTEDKVPATTVAGGTEVVPPDKTTPEKTGLQGFGTGLAEMAKGMQFDPIQISGQAPVDFSMGQPMPSVYRPQLMPSQVQAGVGGMGGGQDMRQLLALLMQGGLG